MELAKAKGKDGGPHWRDYYEFQKNFAQVAYNYAITAHKAQGSTYENVLLFESDILENKNLMERHRIRYTALTRTSKLLAIM